MISIERFITIYHRYIKILIWSLSFKVQLPYRVRTASALSRYASTRVELTTIFKTTIRTVPVKSINRKMRMQKFFYHNHV